MKVKELLRILRSNQGMALAEVEKLNPQGCTVLSTLRTLSSMMPGFQAQMAENVEDRLFAFGRRLKVF